MAASKLSMLRLSTIASLAAAALAQTPPTWVSTNYFSGAACSGTPTAGHVDSPSVWAAANGGQNLACAQDYLSGGGYSMLTCTNGLAQVQKYSDSKCTTPQSPAAYDVPQCTVSDKTWGTYGQTCGTGAFPATGTAIGLTGNNLVVGYGTSCSSSPSGYVFTAVASFGTCVTGRINNVDIAVQASCSGGVLTGSVFSGTTCTGSASSISSSCQTINGVPMTLSCTTPPAKSGAAAAAAGIVAAVAAAAAAISLT